MRHTESTGVAPRGGADTAPGFSEGFSRLLAWSLSSLALLVAFAEALLGFLMLVASSGALGLLGAFSLFFLAYVQYHLSAYLAVHRRELIELFSGEGALASGMDIVGDFLRFLLLNMALLFSYVLIPVGFVVGFAIAEIGSGGGSEVVIPALVTPILCWHYSGRMSTQLSAMLERFSAWDGMTYGIAGRTAGFPGRAAAWFERRIFPPLQMVFPSYIRILPEGAEVDLVAPGADVETTDLIELRSESGAASADVRCQVCGTAIVGTHVRCVRCESPHHVDCWEFNQSCSTYGCGSGEFRTCEGRSS